MLDSYFRNMSRIAVAQKATILIFAFLLLFLLWLNVRANTPVAKWHEAAISLGTIPNQVNQPEHFFVEYKNGHVRDVSHEEWNALSPDLIVFPNQDG